MPPINLEATLAARRLRREHAPIAIKWIAGLLPIFALVGAFIAVPDNWALGVFLWAVLVIDFAVLPATKRPTDQKGVPWYDWLAIALTTAVIAYYVFEYENLNLNMGDYPDWQYAIMVVAIVLSLEAARRAIGPVVPLIGIAIILWALQQGFPSSMILTRLYVGEQGMFGTLTDVFLRYVFLFFIFGAMMERAGAATFLRRYLHAVTGRVTAGAAKAAIFGSGAMGMLIGTSAGNVAVTGSLTIPMMMKEGYEPPKAAAIETVAGLGGELSPPVMGSAVFVLVAYTATPYRDVILISILPAILYYLPIYLLVHFEGARDNRRADAVASEESGWRLLRDYFHLALAPIVLVTLIAVGFSPTYAAAGGIVSVLVLSQLRKDQRLTLRDLARASMNGTMNFITLGASVPVLAIILVLVLLIGLPTIMTAITMKFAGGVILPVMFGIFLLGLVLGMGMPIVAAYMILATVTAPALTSLAIPLLTAHLFILWYTQTAALTPPVALAAQIASAIAGCSMWKTAYQAIRLSVGLFIVPIAMIYGGIVAPEWSVRLWSFAQLSIGFAFWSAAVAGFICTPLGRIERVCLVIAILGVILPFTVLNVMTVALGIGYFGWRIFWTPSMVGKAA
jgi:TRAP transporter 4TM/12TM fusion protein